MVAGLLVVEMMVASVVLLWSEGEREVDVLAVLEIIVTCVGDAVGVQDSLVKVGDENLGPKVRIIVFQGP